MIAQQACNYLDSLGRFGWRLGLDNIRALCRLLGDPQRRFPAVHVAGTNGKGSTAVFIERMLRAAGYRTGLYTSPHLVEVTERIRVDGRQISWSDLGNILEIARPQIDALGATYFEALTAIALRCFAEREVDVGVIEVGLGGRLDATNVVEAELAVFTPIAIDHREHLGRTLSQIAVEKAGIMKANVPCVSATTPASALATLRRRAAEVGAPLQRVSDLCRLRLLAQRPDHSVARLWVRGKPLGVVKIGLPARLQAGNAATAVAAVEVLRSKGWRIPDAAIVEGLSAATWEGRLQRLPTNPPVVLDVAHNPHAIGRLLRSLKEIYPPGEVAFVIGLLADKDAAAIFRLLAESAKRIWCVPLETQRSADPKELCRLAESHAIPVQVARGPVEGLEMALEHSSPCGLVCVTGSHYAVGPILKNLQQKT